MSPLNTQIKQNTTQNKQINLNTGYTLSDVNTEVTISHNIAVMTSGSTYLTPLAP